MKLRLVRTLGSDEDLVSIWEYIAFANPNSGDPDSADRVLGAIEDTYVHLTEFPFKAAITDRNLYRTIVQGFPQYSILYRFDDEKVEVLRVFRGDLDWTRVIENL